MVALFAEEERMRPIVHRLGEWDNNSNFEGGNDGKLM